jgi:hypothetical protein
LIPTISSFPAARTTKDLAKDLWRWQLTWRLRLFKETDPKGLLEHCNTEVWIQKKQHHSIIILPNDIKPPPTTNQTRYDSRPTCMARFPSLSLSLSESQFFE